MIELADCSDIFKEVMMLQFCIQKKDIISKIAVAQQRVRKN